MDALSGRKKIEKNEQTYIIIIIIILLLYYYYIIILFIIILFMSIFERPIVHLSQERASRARRTSIYWFCQYVTSIYWCACVYRCISGEGGRLDYSELRP